jgi:hypothetical protein
VTDRFEVPEELVGKNEYGFRMVDMADLPALLRAEVLRFAEARRITVTDADLDWLDSRYGPTLKSPAPRDEAVLPAFAGCEREAEALLAELAIDARRAFIEKKREAVDAYLARRGRGQ